MPLQTNNQKKKKQVQLLSIDPGFRYFAFALFKDAELQDADILKTKSDNWEVWTKQPPSFLNIAYLLDNYEWEDRKAIIEIPRINQNTPNTEAIIKLSLACGAYTSILQAAGFEVEWVEPKTWKGQVPKDIMCKRIIAKLSQLEYSNIKKPKDHNVIDAIGIGLWKVKNQRNL